MWTNIINKSNLEWLEWSWISSDTYGFPQKQWLEQIYSNVP